MSVSSQITRIKNAISSAYTEISAKGGTVPSSKTVANLADSIDTIPVVDLSKDTVTSGSLLYGVTAHNSSREAITGTIETKDKDDVTIGSNVSVAAGYYSTLVSKEQPTATVKSGSATISSATFTYSSTNNNFGVTGSATVSAPTVATAGYISSSVGTKNTNTASLNATVAKVGTGVTISNGGASDVSISRTDTSGSGATNVGTGTASTTAPTSGYFVSVQSSANTKTLTATPKVTSNGYGTTSNYGATAGTATVGANASDVTYITVPSGDQGAPTATKGTVSNNSISVTPSVTNTAGYIKGGTLNGNAVIIKASDLVSGDKAITPGIEAQTVDVTNYETATVSAMPKGSITSGSATISSAKFTYSSTNDNFGVTGSAGVSVPTVGTPGYVSSAIGAKYTNTASLNATVAKVETGVTISNGGASDVSISRTATSASGATNVGTGTASTTAPTSGYFVSVQSAANTKTLTATPKVTSNGYGTTSNYGATAGTATVGANASDVTYITVPSGDQGTPTATKGTVSNNSISVTPSVTNTAGYISGGTNKGNAVTVSASELVSGNKSLDSSTSAQTGIDVTNYKTVSISAIATATQATPSMSAAHDSTNKKLVVTASSTQSAGYVSAGTTSATYNVADGTITNNTSLPSGSSSSGNLSYGNYIKIGAGYYPSALYYKNGVGAGSATTPSDQTITAAPTITVSSAGLITASYSGSKSITPTVSAGYVSAGTAGTVSSSGSSTKQLTTKAATTYNTSTSDQTISANQYLTGAQTIKAVTTSNISAAYIKSGVTVKVGDANNAGRIANITGTFTSDATAAADKILSGYTAYVNGSKLTGTRTDAFALVIVNYPSGSWFTSASNTYDFTDISTTQRLYYVSAPSSGDTQSCTFTVTNGTDTKSQVVSGITQGSSTTITLSYLLYIYNLGDVCSAVSGGWTGTGYTRGSASYSSSACTLGTDHMTITGTATGGSYGGFLGTANLIDLTNYSTLYIDYYGGTASSSKLYLLSSKTSYLSNIVGSITLTKQTSRSILSISLSSISSVYALVETNSSSGPVYVYQIWAA